MHCITVYSYFHDFSSIHIFHCRCLGGNEHCPYAGFYSPDRTVLTLQGHPEFDSDLMLAIIDLLDGKGLFTKMGYVESVEEIKSMIRLNYNATDVDDGHTFSALLDNIFMGKCIVSFLLPQRCT
jgi:hypothetical protein